MARRNLILIAVAIAIMVFPMFLSFDGDSLFGGTDDQATGEITRIDPGYRPWFSPLWEPPSGEIASLLFSLQAALGAGVLGFYLGLRRGEAKGRRAASGNVRH